MNKPVVKKRKDGFSEVSFSDPEAGEKTEPEPKQEMDGAVPSQEEIVGKNPLTQKPIIRKVERKPSIRGIIEKKDDEERFADDLTVSEMRRKQVRDITPVSNEPSQEQRQLSPAELAQKIWEEKEKKKTWHKKLMGRLGFR